MLRFGFFAGFRSFTGRERLRYTLAIHEGRSNEPGKPPNPHAHLIWSDRGHDGIERTASTWFKRYNGKAPERGGGTPGAADFRTARTDGPRRPGPGDEAAPSPASGV